MAMKHLGETLDIHCGGVDNIFPHHENEIAQSEAVTGKPFVRFWIHGEHLLVEGEKMAKSKGNFYTLARPAREGLRRRWPFATCLLSVPYRKQLNFTFDGLDAGAALAGSHQGICVPVEVGQACCRAAIREMTRAVAARARRSSRPGWTTISIRRRRWQRCSI